MSTAQLLIEALDTVGVLLRAGATWLVLVAVAASLALYAVGVILWSVCRWAWKTARRVLYGPRSAEQAPQAPEPLPNPERRPRPSWACEQPTTYDDLEEAA